MAEPLRHRQTKEAETDMSSLKPPRHIPTLPISDGSISAYHRIIAKVANVAGHAPDGRTEPYRNALPDNPAARRGGLADITRTAGRIRSAPAYHDARFSLGREILASQGERCEHGDRDQSSRQELDCSHRTLLLASATQR